jgi:hypothetical protein
MLTKIPEMIKMADSRKQVFRSYQDLLIWEPCANVTKKRLDKIISPLHHIQIRKK